MKSNLISYINAWGQRFKDDTSLKSQLESVSAPETEVDTQ